MKRCKKNNHYWHPVAMIDWRCCVCGTMTDGPAPTTGNLWQTSHVCLEKLWKRD